MIAPLFQDIAQEFPFEPTHEQILAINRLAGFMSETAPRQVFLLKGYAGTGKTAIVSALVRTLVKHNRRVVLMAPTGRAAKVGRSYRSCDALVSAAVGIAGSYWPCR